MRLSQKPVNTARRRGGDGEKIQDRRPCQLEFGSRAGARDNCQGSHTGGQLQGPHPPCHGGRAAIRNQERQNRSHRVAQGCRAPAPALIGLRFRKRGDDTRCFRSCLFRVKLRHRPEFLAGPFIPQERTLADALGMSVSCQRYFPQNAEKEKELIRTSISTRAKPSLSSRTGATGQPTLRGVKLAAKLWISEFIWNTRLLHSKRP